MEEYEMKDVEIMPLIPGFRFECQMCGNCCMNVNRPMTIDEMQYFHDHKLKYRFTITTSKVDGRVLSIFPCKPVGEMCGASFIIDRSCLIYDERPVGCKMYPFIMRVYFKTPPTYEEITKSMRLTDTKGVKIKQFIRKLDEHRWIFLGCPKTDVCPGIGKGEPWQEWQIKKFIADNLYAFINARDLMNETSNILIDHFNLDDPKQLEKYFIIVRRVFSDDDVITSVYEPINRIPGDFIGNTILDKPLQP